jgi:hypothetical protein
LSPRPERPEVTPLQSNEEIVSMGTYERLAAAHFLWEARPQQLLEERHRGRITQ